MNIAIPTFGSRVSPRFDLAARLLIVKIQGSEIADRREHNLERLYGCQRIGFLRAQNVDLVLCGGIRRSEYFWIVDAGIEVFAGLMGEVDDILDAFLKGDISARAPAGVFAGRNRSGSGRRMRRRGGSRVTPQRDTRRIGKDMEPGESRR
jgi:predicted Fe-Mo cluster-binding NifX family protein